MKIDGFTCNRKEQGKVAKWMKLMVLLAIEKSKVRSDESYHPGFPHSLGQNFSFIFSIAANCMTALTPTITHAHIFIARHQTLWDWDPSFCHDQYTNLLNGFPFRTAFSTFFIDWLMTICKRQGGTLEPLMWHKQNTSMWSAKNMEIPCDLLMICHQKKDPSVTYYGSAFKRKSD